MSRSYKQNPVLTDGSPHSTKKSKKFANKSVRNTELEELPLKGNGYKKIFESYNIHDWITRYTKQDWADNYFKHKYEYTFKQYMKLWERYYKRK
jgi:hypothetical protein